MRRVRDGEVEWLTFDLLNNHKEIKHAVFLRKGGSSSPPYASLNFSYSSGDTPNCVAANRAKACAILGCEKEYIGKLMHGKAVREVRRDSAQQLEACDGLMSAEKNLGLLTTHADCQATFFYDPVKKVAAVVHCGWRGNVFDIYGETVKSLHARYGSNPADILACVGPSLGPSHAEFINYKQEFPEEFWEFQPHPFHFNLWEIARMQLKRAGLLTHHIEIAALCTFENSSDFFSYRREGAASGRHGSMLLLV